MELAKYAVIVQQEGFGMNRKTLFHVALHSNKECLMLFNVNTSRKLSDVPLAKIGIGLSIFELFEAFIWASKHCEYLSQGLKNGLSSLNWLSHIQVPLLEDVYSLKVR